MAENPYFALSREELREEIKREREQRKGFRSEISRLKDELREIRREVHGYYELNGDEFSNEAVTDARTAATGGSSAALAARSRLNRTIGSTAAGQLVYAARWEPWRLTTRESVIEEDPQRALREAEISRLERDVDLIDAELEKKEEAKRPPYVEAEYCKYYRYLSATKPRHFEARGTVTVPPGVDPLGAAAMNAASYMLDVAMDQLGIDVDYDMWYIGWCTANNGVELTGDTAKSFRSTVRVTVTDLARPRQGPWSTNVTVSEADFL